MGGMFSNVWHGASAPEHFSELLVRASDGVYEWDLETDRLYWSQSQFEVLGMDPADFVPRGSTFFDRVHPEDRAQLSARLAAHLERGEPYVVRFRVRHEAGHYLEAEGAGVAQRDENGKPLRLVGIMRDVSERAAIENELFDTRALFESLAQNIPGVIFQYVLHPDGTDQITRISPACQELFELSVQEVVNDAARVWGQILPEFIPAMQASIQASAETLTRWDHTWQIEVPSGARKWIHGRGAPTRMEDGRVVWHSVCLDVTDRVEAEREAAQSRDMLSRIQRLESLSALSGGLAHDFNNLLSVIASSLEILDDTPDAAARAELISDALDAVERGGQLTRRLLTVSKKAKLEPETLELCAVVESMRHLLERALPEQVSLELCLDAPAARIMADRAALENALLNLVLNARDAMPDGGVVRVSVESEAGLVRIVVTDSGEGMPEEVRARALEPFFTTKPLERGTGLGLATVNGFVAQSNGELCIESEPGEGTTLTLSFPAADQEPPSARPLEAGGGSILLVEDEPSLRRAFARQLERAGFRVDIEATGDGAWQRLQDRRYDLLLTDVQMPGMLLGDALATRALEAGRVRGAVLISGNPNDGFLEHENHGAPNLRALLKPLGREALVSHVREVLAVCGPSPGAVTT